MSGSGHENLNFLSENNEDFDRIEVITTSTTSSRSDLIEQPEGSQNKLTNIGNDTPLGIFACSTFAAGAADDNKSRKSDCAVSRDGIEEQYGDESIELIRNFGKLQQKRSISPLAVLVNSFSRGATPTNMVRRWSLNLSRFDRHHKHSLRRSTIYRMPSRKLFDVDGNLLPSSEAEAENEVALLVQEIEQHDGLMQDTALSHQHRLETLRALPQPLYMKRLLKQKLAITIEQQASEKQRCIWCHHLMNAFISMLLISWKRYCAISQSMEIWYDDLKAIEGHFGCNISSFFKFLRWLLMLNIFILICICIFIIFPQILYNAVKTEVQPTDKTSSGNSADGMLFNLLTGEGWLQTSLMFYSGYSNATFRLHPALGQYSLPHAYFMTMLVLYLVTFIVVSTKMARIYRISFIQAAGSSRGMLTAQTFSAWDFGISNRKAAELKHIAIFTELKAVLNEKAVPKSKLTAWCRIRIFCSRAIAHILVVALICGVGIGVWILLKELDSTEIEIGKQPFVIAVILNLTMLLMQSVLSWISRMEDYRSPRRTLHIALFRNFMLEIAIISVLVYFLLTKQYSECWETHIGQELYRFIIMDSLICLTIIPLICAIRSKLSKHLHWLCSPEFDIPQKSLGLVYNQSLLWLGLLFAPLLVAIIVCKMFLSFYINKMLLLHLCKPCCHIWRSAQTQTLYLVFTFVSLLGVILILGYIMTQLPMSSNCGPFRDSAYMFQIFIDGVLQLRQNQRLWRLLTLLIRPAAVGLMLVIMMSLVYYLRAKSRARCLMVKLLKEMIYLEAKDKEFLLNRIMNITKNRDQSLFDGRSNGGKSHQSVPRTGLSNIFLQNEMSTPSHKEFGRSVGLLLRSRNR